jgi:hypothetical protein
MHYPGRKLALKSTIVNASQSMMQEPKPDHTRLKASHPATLALAAHRIVGYVLLSS